MSYVDAWVGVLTHMTGECMVDGERGLVVLVVAGVWSASGLGRGCAAAGSVLSFEKIMTPRAKSVATQITLHRQKAISRHEVWVLLLNMLSLAQLLAVLG